MVVTGLILILGIGVKWPPVTIAILSLILLGVLTFRSRELQAVITGG